MEIDGITYFLCNNDETLIEKMRAFTENARQYKYKEILKLLHNEDILMPFWCGLLDGLYHINPYYIDDQHQSLAERKFYNTILRCAQYIMHDKNIPIKINEYGYKVPNLYGRIVYNSINKYNKFESKMVELTEKIFDKYVENYPRMIRILYEINVRTINLLFSQISDYIFGDYINAGNEVKDIEYVFSSSAPFFYIFQPFRITTFDDINHLKYIIDNYIFVNDSGNKQLDLNAISNDKELNFDYIKHYNYVEDTITFSYVHNTYSYNVAHPGKKVTINAFFQDEYQEEHYMSDYYNIVEAIMFIKCTINGKASLVVPYSIFDKTYFKIIDDDNPFTLIDLTKLSIYSNSNDDDYNSISNNQFIRKYNHSDLQEIANETYIDFRETTRCDIFDYYRGSFSPIMFYRYNVALLYCTRQILMEYAKLYHEHFCDSYNKKITYVNPYKLIYHMTLQFFYKNDDENRINDNDVIATYYCDITIDIKEHKISVIPIYESRFEIENKGRNKVDKHFKLVNQRFNEIYQRNKNTIIRDYNYVITKSEEMFNNSDEVFYNGNFENFMIELKFIFGVDLDFDNIKSIKMEVLDSNENS